MKSNFTLTLWTNNPKIAKLADQCGIDRIGVDLEILGKHQRQGHKNTWISNHTMEDIKAVRIINELIKLDTIGEIFLGLNDLSISLNKPLKNRFQVLLEPFIKTISDQVNSAGINFGFGGLARIGDNSLPISPDLIYAQYARLNAHSALIAQSFLQNLPLHKNSLQFEINSTRERLNYWHSSNTLSIHQAHQSLANYFM